MHRPKTWLSNNSALVCLCSLTICTPQREVRWMAFAPSGWKLMWGCYLLCIHQIVRLHVLFCTFENGKNKPRRQLANCGPQTDKAGAFISVGHCSHNCSGPEEPGKAGDFWLCGFFAWAEGAIAFWVGLPCRPDHCSSSMEVILTTVMGAFIPTVWRAALQLDDLNSTIMWTQTWRWYKKGSLCTSCQESQIWAIVNRFRYILDSQKGFPI